MPKTSKGLRFVSPFGAEYTPLRDAKAYSSLPVLNLASGETLPRTENGGLDDSNNAVNQGVADGMFWRPNTLGVNGKTLLCSCPECNAPLTVRVWLLTVNCWQCGANVALDELEYAFEEEAEPSTEAAPARMREKRESKKATKSPTRKSPSSVVDAQIAGVPSPPPLTEPAVRFRFLELFDNMPAWLASLMVHLIFLILLALFNLKHFQKDDSITLSTSVGPADREDINAPEVDRIDNVNFELPVPETDQPTNRRERQKLILANEAAKELRMDPDENRPELPDLAQLKRIIGSDVDQRTLAVRDPRIRVDMIRREGGTTLTEAAVARGLQWIADHQNSDGSWSTHAFHRCEKCRRRCNGVRDKCKVMILSITNRGPGDVNLI